MVICGGANVTSSIDVVFRTTPYSMITVLDKISMNMNGPVLGTLTNCTKQSPISLQQSLSLVIDQCTSTSRRKTSMAHCKCCCHGRLWNGVAPPPFACRCFVTSLLRGAEIVLVVRGEM